MGRSATCVVMITAGLFTSAAAQAQSAAEVGSQTAPPVTNATVGEVVVTAQRRAENVQKVPIAITTLSATGLAKAGIENLSQIGVAVPGLNFQSIQGLATPRLRGIGSAASGPGVEPEVAVYVDGVYYASAAASILSFNNVSQVTVLKGPQGTLFGRNAVGGLVQIATADPTQSFHMRGETGYGNYDTSKTKLYITGGPNPYVAADLAIQANFQGKGYGRNLLTGQDTQRTDHDLAVRSKLLIRPTPSTKIMISGDYSDTVGTPASIRLEPGSRAAPGTGPNYGGSVWDINNDVNGYVKTHTSGVSIKIDQKLGRLTLSSISALRHLAYSNALDLDASPTPYQAVVKHQNDDQLSQEFQLQSPSNTKFNWTIGVYYFDLSSKYNPNNFLLSGAAVNPFFPLVRSQTFSTQTARSIAGYGQATYEVLPKTHLTFGMRYTNEQRNLTGVNTLFFRAPKQPTATTVALGPLSVSRPTYRAALDYQLFSDVLLYASYNTSFKSGGYNSGSITKPGYRPEFIKAYEAGFKSQALDRRLTFNASGFYYDYTNIQEQMLSSGALNIINGAAATVYGADIDAAALVTPDFRVTTGLEVLHSRFDSFPNAPISTPAGGVAVVTGSATGNQLPVASPFTATVSGDYTHTVQFGVLDGSATVAYNSGWYTEPDNAVRQNDFVQINASLRWTSPDGRYTASLWGDNLTNAKSRANATTLAFGNHVVSFNPPLTFGGTVGFKF